MDQAALRSRALVDSLLFAHVVARPLVPGRMIFSLSEARRHTDLGHVASRRPHDTVTHREVDHEAESTEGSERTGAVAGFSRLDRRCLRLLAGEPPPPGWRSFSHRAGRHRRVEPLFRIPGTSREDIAVPGFGVLVR